MLLNINEAIVFGLYGAITGYMIPSMVQKISCYKCTCKGTGLALSFRCTSPLLKLAACMSNMAAWAFTGLKMDSFLAALLPSVLFTVSMVIAMIDMQIKIIPNELVLTMLACGALMQIMRGGVKTLFISVLVMLGMMLLFSAVAGIVGFAKVGAGDVKLAGAMGLALGYPGIITALVVMSAAILIYSLFGLIFKKLTLHSMVPFAPFMMSGMVFSLVFTIIGV